MTKIELTLYEDLEKHFIQGKIKPAVKRVPRKFKKEYKHILCGKRYDYLELGQKLWYIQGLINPNYNRFLIKMAILNDNKRKQNET